MYSEQELTKIISEVFDQKVQEGALDDSIASAVDAYLVEHPVDITALEGQTIAPAVVAATTSISAPAGTFTSINGESNPSVKPIYCHPVTIRSSNDKYAMTFTMLIFNNSATAFSLSSFKTWMDNLYSQIGSVRLMTSGGFYVVASQKVIINAYLYKGSTAYGVYGVDISNGQPIDISEADFDDLITAGGTTFNDDVNKIN